MKINLVMIVKNEERSLRRCLEAAKPLVDEILITDTGSSDRTVATFVVVPFLEAPSWSPCFVVVCLTP